MQRPRCSAKWPKTLRETAPTGCRGSISIRRRGVSAGRSIIREAYQASPERIRGRRPRGVELPVPLLLPRIGVVVVPVLLPEPRLVLGGELQPPEPLGALPEVALGHEEA